MTGEDIKEPVATEPAQEKEQDNQLDTAAQDEESAETEEQDDELTGDDSDAGTDDPDGGEPEQVEAPTKPVSRAQARIQGLSERLKLESAEKERLIHERATAQAQLEHLRQQQREVQSAQERRAEDERLALLDPQERAVYQANQQIRNLEYRLNQMEMQRGNDQDRATFHAKAAHDETYAKYADEIEKAYQDGVNRGVSAPREDLLAWKIGKEILQNKNKEGAKKKATATKRIDSVTAKPASARGDVTGSKKGKTEEDRLRGVLI